MKLTAKFGFALMIFVYAAAKAQQPVIPATPEAQALAQKLMAEINGNIQCTATDIILRQQLIDVNAKLKALEDKYEPKDKPK